MSTLDSYNEWIKAQQESRNASWKQNVKETSEDSKHPPKFDGFSLFHDGAEEYAMANTTIASENVQTASKVTQNENLFAPCMVGAMESQFLKMQCQIKKAKRCLDIGTFTGMSAIAMAEGMSADGKVITLENHEPTAKVAQKIFDQTSVKDKIEIRIGSAVEAMEKSVENGEKFDIIFIDADKENYTTYYKLAKKCLADDGIILADNCLCALLYDQGTDYRSQALHEFNQFVKNDPETEQVILTIREGITLIRMK